mgnify:FL=1
MVPMKFGTKRRTTMSGDIGLHQQPIIFYHEEMTEAKKIVLQSRGIKLDYLDNKNIKDVTDSNTDWEDFWTNEDRPE